MDSGIISAVSFEAVKAVTVYEASDGTRFDSKESAFDHEVVVKYKKAFRESTQHVMGPIWSFEILTAWMEDNPKLARGILDAVTGRDRNE